MLKAAHKYNLKKEIHYDTVDPFLNVPTDSKKRPLRFHSEIMQLTKKK